MINFQAITAWTSLSFITLLIAFNLLLAKAFYHYTFRPVQLTCEQVVRRLQDRGLSYFAPNKFGYMLESIEYYFDQILDQLDTNRQLLLESELSYSTILDTQSEFVLVISDSGYIKYCNRAFANFFQAVELLSGLSKDHLAIFSLPDSVAELIDEADSTMRRAQLTGEPQHHQSTVDVEEQQYFISWTIKSLTPTITEEHPEAEFLLVGRDETLNRSMEERTRQLESLATVGRMASTISHEINQPLSIIRLSLSNLMDMIQQGDLNSEEAEDKFRHMLFQVERSEKIIRNLKSFNSATQQHIQLEPFDVNAILYDIVQEQRLLAEIDDICIDTEIPETPCLIKGNVTLFEQVIHNLITNSVYALKEETDNLHKRWIMLQSNILESSVEILLVDNGPGVPEDLLNKIASPFFSTKPPGKGSGIGLSLSYDVIQKMKGVISLSNRPSGGFRVAITLPLATT